MNVSLENIIRVMVDDCPNIRKGSIKDDNLSLKIYKILFSFEFHGFHASKTGSNKQRFISIGHVVG